MANVLSAGNVLRRTTSLPHCGVPAACVLLVMVVVALRLASHGGELLNSLGDTDDATRLVQLHAYLQHGHWYDLTLERIGAPDALVSHWSRFIDLGLAVILGGARLVLSPPHAEIAMRIVWPSLLLLTLVMLVVREVRRDGGIWAAIAMIGLIMTTQSALFQFNAGRIDHHNAQIVCAVGGVLLLARSLVAPRAGWWAGMIIGTGLTVGLESALLVGPAMIVCVLLGLGRARGLEGPVRGAAMMAATLALGAVLSIDPARWGVFVCDAVSFNLVALAALCAGGVAAAAMVARRLVGVGLVATQLSVLAIAGAGGLTVYGLLEPACLAGPFGQVAPEVWPVWLSHVGEAQPIGYLYRQSPGVIIGFCAVVVLGLLARLRLAFDAREAHGQCDDIYRHAMLFAAQAIAFVAACWQVKMTPYAAWLALPALSCVIATLPGLRSLSAPVVRLAALLFVSQGTLTMVAGGALAVVGEHHATPMAKRTACSDTPTISELAHLPPGLVLADLDLGPYIVALSPHRVLMAPYHRLDRSIIEGQRLLRSSPAAAEQGLRLNGVTYVIGCRQENSKGDVERPSRDRLEDVIATGDVPNYLVPVNLPEAPRLRVYRIATPGR